MIGPTTIAVLIVLLKNFAVLVSGFAAYCWVRRPPSDKGHGWRYAAEAAILTLITCYSIVSRAEPVPGMFFDGRYILIPLATIFSGPTIGLMVSLSAIAVRGYLGGVGAGSGVFSILIVFLGSLWCWRFFRTRGRLPRRSELIWIALLSTTLSMTGWLFLPWSGDLIRIAAESRLALFIINPLAILALGSMVLWDHSIKEMMLMRADENARFRAVIDNLPLTLRIHALDGRITSINKRYSDIYGLSLEDFVGKSQTELHDFLLTKEQRVLSDKDTQGVLSDGRPRARYLKDVPILGKPRSILVTKFGIPNAAGKLDAVGTIGVDVSELRQRERELESLQSQLVQAGKMEAIGQLAGGVAHDFNNLLGAIIGFAGFLRADLEGQPALQSHANRILQICDRAKALVTQILAFARADRVERGLIDLRLVIAETRDLMRPTIPATTNLIYELGTEPIWLKGNVGQISQIIVNLSINASDALDGLPGDITIGLTTITPGQEYLDANFQPLPERCVFGTLVEGEDYVRLQVSDNGSGMDSETLGRIMEPFFTTKGRREGTGLGLPIVHGIVMAYGGAYTIESRLGHGTRFSIYFPAPQPELLEVAGPAQDSQSAVVGHERIMIIDDQQDSLDVFLIGLERMGFEVGTCNDPIEALELFSEDPATWDLVVSDQIMPGMLGTDMLARMRALRPELPTILCTGFGELGTKEPLNLDCVSQLVTKPVEPAALGAQIRGLLDRPPEPKPKLESKLTVI